MINILAITQEERERQSVKESAFSQTRLQKYILHRRKYDCVLSSAVINIQNESRDLRFVLLSSELAIQCV
jgi:hypothetical protein